MKLDVERYVQNRVVYEVNTRRAKSIELKINAALKKMEKCDRLIWDVIFVSIIVSAIFPPIAILVIVASVIIILIINTVHSKYEKLFKKLSDAKEKAEIRAEDCIGKWRR